MASVGSANARGVAVAVKGNMAGAASAGLWVATGNGRGEGTDCVVTATDAWSGVETGDCGAHARSAVINATSVIALHVVLCLTENRISAIPGTFPVIVTLHPACKAIILAHHLPLPLKSFVVGALAH